MRFDFRKPQDLEGRIHVEAWMFVGIKALNPLTAASRTVARWTPPPCSSFQARA